MKLNLYAFLCSAFFHQVHSRNVLLLDDFSQVENSDIASAGHRSRRKLSGKLSDVESLDLKINQYRDKADELRAELNNLNYKEAEYEMALANRQHQIAQAESKMEELRSVDMAQKVAEESRSDPFMEYLLEKNRLETESREPRAYKYMDSEEIYKEMHRLSKEYSDFITLTSAQEKYGLPRMGDEEDCDFERNFDNDGGRINKSTTSYRTYDWLSSYIRGASRTNEAGCTNLIMTIEDPTHPASHELPEVLISGAFHGNERIGPTATMEMAKLLVEAAYCEREISVNKSAVCRSDMVADGVNDEQRQWLARLVSTRRIVLTPTTNALGYFRNVRDEDGLDPNRDFPIDLQEDIGDCLQTVTARMLDNLFRDHIFTSVITFHSGTTAIAYGWGCPSRMGVSPDDASQKELGYGLSDYAGGLNQFKKSNIRQHIVTHEAKGYYPAAVDNFLVYPVRGGFEDYAYAASWDKPIVGQCYDVDADYNDASWRTATYLVETSNMKTPLTKTLGTTDKLLGHMPLSNEANGHISRNIRLALMLVDTVQPYVFIRGADSKKFSSDKVPYESRSLSGSREACQDAKSIVGYKSNGKVNVEWKIGGAFTVNDTYLMHLDWDDLSSEFGCTESYDSLNTFVNRRDSVQFSDFQNGKTHWHADSYNQARMEGGEFPDAIFNADVDLSNYKAGSKIAVVAVAKVDQDWKEVDPKSVPKGLGPQSHLANARTNSNWRFENKGKVVQGRTMWLSTPMTIVVHD